MDHQKGGKLLRIHAQTVHFVHLHIVIVNPLTSGGDLHSPEQQVKTQRKEGSSGSSMA